VTKTTRPPTRTERDAVAYRVVNEQAAAALETTTDTTP
jgi:hypothetical protein